MLLVDFKNKLMLMRGHILYISHHMFHLNYICKHMVFFLILFDGRSFIFNCIFIRFFITMMLFKARVVEDF